MSKVVTAQELLNSTRLAAGLIEKTFEALKEGWAHIPGYVFPCDNLILTAVYPNTHNTVYVQFITEDGKNLGTAIPKTFPFKILEGQIKEKLEQVHDEHFIRDLPNKIQFAGHVGADPEIFVEDENGQVIPAFKFLGSKKQPNKYASRRGGYNSNLYWDGFQAEYDTVAMGCLGYFADCLQGGLEGILNAARKINPKAKLSTKTVVDIPFEVIKGSAPEHVEFGCMPSLNVYGMKGLQKPGSEVFYRAAGGHIHLGIGKRTEEKAAPIIKALDAVLGVAGVSLCKKFDDPRRRQMYGLAGEYRLPAHGIEYRVLSNAWLYHPMPMNIVFDLARSAARFGEMGLLHMWKATETETIECINNCDVKKAHEILLRNEDLLKKLIDVRYHDANKVNFTFKVIMDGMESVLATPEDVERNWNLNVTNGEWIGHCDGPGKNVHTACTIKGKIA